jgi:hypothetical protein
MTPSRPPPRGRPLRRLLGRLTLATLGATIAAPSDDASAADHPPGATAPDRDTDDLYDAVDPRGDVAAHWLAVSLERMPGLGATQTACRWALSPEVDQRLTVAAALEWTFRLLGDSVIIDHLSRDPDARVRVAAARAAWARHAAGGDPGVLTRLAGDPAAEVREVAILALRGRGR